MSGEKIILLQELCLLADVILCFGIPIIGVILLAKRSKRVLKPFLIGMAAFIVSQLLIRIPIISYVLPNFTWYLLLQQNIYLYGIFLGLTAGLFEEIARLIFMKRFLKNRTRLEDGLAFGLGHGGIEAMVFVGVNSLVTMFVSPMGYYDLSDIGYLALLTAGVERIFAITFHVGASLIILYGIRTKRAGRYTILAILLHAIVDSMAVILPTAFGLSSFGLEVFVMLVSCLLLAFACHLFIRLKSAVQPV